MKTDSRNGGYIATISFKRPIHFRWMGLMGADGKKKDSIHQSHERCIFDGDHVPTIKRVAFLLKLVPELKREPVSRVKDSREMLRGGHDSPIYFILMRL